MFYQTILFNKTECNKIISLMVRINTEVNQIRMFHLMNIKFKMMKPIAGL